MSIATPLPAQTKRTGTAAGHRTGGKRTKPTDNYFLDALFGNKANQHWERKIKVK